MQRSVLRAKGTSQPGHPLVLPLRQASRDQAGVECFWVCRVWGFWQWEYLEGKSCYKSAQMRAQKWGLAEGLHSLVVMGQIWSWAVALPGSSWWQRRRGHTDTNTENKAARREACVHGTRQMGTILSPGHNHPLPLRRRKAMVWQLKPGGCLVFSVKE